MTARFGKWFVVLALVLTTGLHWATLQTVAWATMLADHLRSDSLSIAVAKTFDGEHLCPLCRAIAAAKKSEKKAEAVASALKMEYPPVAPTTWLFPPPLPRIAAANLFPVDSPSFPPPSPPPRGCFA